MRGLPNRFVFGSIDGASLAVFRGIFGLLIAIEAIRFLANGWVAALFVEPRYFFTLPFVPLRPWPTPWIYFHFGVVALAGVLVSLGLFYRLAAIVLFLGFTFILLLDVSYTLELNHFYLMALIAFLMCWMPAARVWSLDARRSAASGPRTVPAWCLITLRCQMFLVYFYAGLAKVNSDWLTGHPLRELVGSPTIAVALSWAGLFFDLSIGPLLVWRRSRRFALVAAGIFHLVNASLFHIGVFPYLAMALTLLFLPPDWPRRFVPLAEVRPADVLPSTSGTTFILVALYLAIQVMIPLRHWYYAGDPSWTEQGHYLSWRMMMIDKQGSLEVSVFNPVTMRTMKIDPHDELTAMQYESLATRPELARIYAHHVADTLAPVLGVRPEVRIRMLASLNGRPPSDVIDKERDLASEPFRFGDYDWVTPYPARQLAPQSGNEP